MGIRALRFLVAAPLLLAGLAWSCSVLLDEHRRPDILLLTIDTLRADHLGAYGYPRETSPHLDRLMAESVRFAIAQTPWPKTGPAFAAIFTATYPKDNGIVRRIGDPIPCSRRMLAEELQAHGYETRAVVANGAVGREFFFDQGFDAYVEAWRGSRTEAEIEAATRADRVTDLALAQLAARDPKRPLFLWVHYLDPHFPYRPPGDAAERFQGDNVVATGARLPVDRRRRRRMQGGVGTDQLLSGREDLDFYIARYDAEIAFADGEIGRLLDAIEERAPGARPLVTALTADHGESLGEHDYYFDHGLLPFQASVQVPLAIRYPGELAPAVDPHPASLVDLAPTLLDFAGVELEEGTWAQGRSLEPHMKGEEAPHRRVVFTEAGYGTQRGWMKAATDGRFKLVWAPDPEAQEQVGAPGHETLLFDLTSDPGETLDLAVQHPEIQAELAHAVWAWFEAPPFAVDNDDEECSARAVQPDTLEQLRALGYL